MLRQQLLLNNTLNKSRPLLLSSNGEKLKPQIKSQRVYLSTPPSVGNPVESPPAPRIPQQYPPGTDDHNINGVILSSPQLKDQGMSQPVGRKLVNAYGVINEKAEIGPMKISRRALLSNDVEIDLHFCGICHSDIHHVYNEWRDSIYPMVPGHEMVGLVSRVGSSVTKFKIGDRVAIGNLVNSCRQCESCHKGNEQYCLNGGPSWVYNGHERNPGELYPMGELTLGGYSDMIVVNEDFVLNLPDNLELSNATPLLCAGITMFTPLIQRKIGPGSVVGVAGIGGLGHLGIKMAKAMGATVVAITRTEWKLKDAQRLGADYAILASDDSQMRKAQGTIDLILDTIPHPHDMDPYLNLLSVGGILWILGTLEYVQPFNGKLATNMNRFICASNVGGIPSTKDMLTFCSQKGIVADIELIPIESVRESFDRIRLANVRYRFVIDLKRQLLNH